MKEDPSLKVTEVAKIAGEKWKNLTAEQQLPYSKMHENDIIRHDQEMKQLLSQGFFINSNGVKSTDMQVKRKRIPAATESVKSDATAMTNATSKAQSQVS